MNTVSIKRCSPQLKRIFALARKDDVVLRTDDGTEMLLSQIDDFDYEIAAQRRSKALMAFLDRARRTAQHDKSISLEEVRLRLGGPAWGKNGRKEGAGHAKSAPIPRRISISRRSPAILGYLAKARADSLIVKVTDGHEYVLTPIKNGDRADAKRRGSDAVMKYLDGLSDDELPPLEVVFVHGRRTLSQRTRTSRRKKPANHDRANGRRQSVSR